MLHSDEDTPEDRAADHYLDEWKERRLEQAFAEARYYVRYGYYGQARVPFRSFADALAFYRATPGATLTGVDVDGDCDEDGVYMVRDGLTDEEREQL